MHNINWIHLTDLHFGQESQEWLWPTFRELLYSDLKKLYEVAGPWDIVFFSGDLTQSGKKEEFDGLSLELKSLWEHFRSMGCDPIFLSVPGNHDLVRPPSSSAVVKALKNWESDDELKKLVLSSEPNEYRDIIEKCFQNYTNWYNELLLPKASEYIRGILPGDFSAIIEKNGTRIGIVGLNSSFLQLSGGNYKEKLDIHNIQLSKVCNGDPPRWCSELDLALLMTHHDPSWFNKASQQNLISEICPPGRFFSHICGHLHNPCAQDISRFGSEVLRLRQGHSLFGLETYGDNPINRSHGYVLGRFEIENNVGRELLWPRIGKQAYSGQWIIAPNTGYNLDESNSISSDFNLKPRVRTNKTLTNSVIKNGIVELETSAKSKIQNEGMRLEESSAFLQGISDSSFAKEKLKDIPRYRLQKQDQHQFIRIDEQERFNKILNNNRCAWLVADWGTGKEGFLSLALHRLQESNAALDIFRLKCEEVTSVEQLHSLMNNQFGLSLQEFFAYSNVLPGVIFLFEDIPSEISVQDSSLDYQENLQILVETILDYCPNLKLIITSSRAPKNAYFENVQLNTLEILEVQAYVQNHPLTLPGIGDSDVLDQLYTWSGGLPMYLDKYLSELKVSTMKELSENELDHHEIHDSQSVPKALQKVISNLERSNDRYSRRSFRMLKVLSVLSNGESLNTIKRFYQNEPFYSQNASELLENSLIEVVLLVKPGDELVQQRAESLSRVNDTKILRVLKHVRDYIRSIMNEEEYSEIIELAANLYFGNDWRNGKIRISREDFLAKDDRTFSDPGNKYIIIGHLLKKSLHGGNCDETNRATNLAINYVKTLRDCARYKDVCFVAKELLYILEDCEINKEIAELTLEYGSSLRMLGKSDEALEELQTLQKNALGFLSKIRQASLFLDLAFLNSDDTQTSISMAKKVQELTDKDSPMYLQALDIILSSQPQTEERDKKLVKLEKTARKNEYNTLANNITYFLAANNKDKNKAIESYNKILNSTDDIYNYVKAIIKKAEVLLDECDDGIKINDLLLLGQAYSYAFTQRMSSIFTRCHNVLWKYFLKQKQLVQLLRIFRHSSFFWRIKGDNAQEMGCIKILNGIDINSIASNEERSVQIDINYFRVRNQYFNGIK
ncbi:MAG: metallophosphoesterase [Clostridia bacterium]|nr:metallophosphoesterase [Clostridia bacterium]